MVSPTVLFTIPSAILIAGALIWLVTYSVTPGNQERHSYYHHESSTNFTPTICLFCEEFLAANEKLIRYKPCNHTVHKRCISYKDQIIQRRCISTGCRSTKFIEVTEE